MQNIWFLSAGMTVCFSLIIHVVVGGKLFVRALMADDIPAPQKWMAYYMWHAATFGFVFVAAGFFAAAWKAEHLDYGVIATAYSACFVGIAIFVCIKGCLPNRSFPSIPIFSLVTCLGLIGALTS
jgi:hypothetical protein